MRNCIVLSRDRYNAIRKYQGRPHYTNPSFIITNSVMILLDFFIIENKDGSAQFLKNRRNGQMFMTANEYQDFKKEVSDAVSF